MGVIAYLDFILCRHININTRLIWRLERDKIMKLEVGMYVRTDKGYISQITDFKEHYTKGKRLINSYSTKEVVENYLSLKGNQCEFIESIDYSIPPCYPSDEELEKIKSHIVKASNNIIDLIEVGDYVNGYKISAIYDDDSEVNEYNLKHKKCLGKNIYDEDYQEYLIYEEDIETIVTSQQFESMQYKVD